MVDRGARTRRSIGSADCRPVRSVDCSLRRRPPGPPGAAHTGSIDSRPATARSPGRSSIACADCSARTCTSTSSPCDSQPDLGAPSASCSRPTTATSSDVQSRQLPMGHRHGGLHIRRKPDPAAQVLVAARAPRSTASTSASADDSTTRPYSMPDGSTSTLAANRSPPTWLHSHTRPGRTRSSAAATGRPRIAQQTSWVPCAQTANSGASGDRLAGPSGPTGRGQDRRDIELQQVGVVVELPPHQTVLDPAGSP